MDTAQWPQEIVVKPMEEIIVPTTCTNIISTNTNKCPSTPLERKVRPEKDQALNCPRCNSTNTKFCYYNNYSLTQPRYFCKTCRRYWTEGGSLRNIPVGGGSRKNNKRPSSSSSSSPNSSSSPSAKNPRITLTHIHHQPQPQPQDLNLGFPLSEFIHLPPTTIETLHQPQDLNLGYSSPYLQDFKPTLNFSLDGLGNGGFSGGFQQGEDQTNEEGNGGRLLFPLFEDLKQVSSSNNTSSNTNNTAEVLQNEQKQGEQHQSTGFWSGMLGMGGASW